MNISQFKRIRYGLGIVLCFFFSSGCLAFVTIPNINKPSDKTFLVPNSEQPIAQVKAEDKHISDSGHEDASHPGMPQMDVKTFPSQIFWLVVTFAFLWLCIARLTFPRLQQILGDRQKKIDDEIQSAERLQVEAKKIKLEFEEALIVAKQDAQRRLHENHAALQHQMELKMKESNDEWQNKLSFVENEILIWKEKTLELLPDLIVALTQEILEKLLGRKIAKDQLDKMVRQTMHHGL